MTFTYKKLLEIKKEIEKEQLIIKSHKKEFLKGYIKLIKKYNLLIRWDYDFGSFILDTDIKHHIKNDIKQLKEDIKS